MARRRREEEETEKSKKTKLKDKEQNSSSNTTSSCVLVLDDHDELSSCCSCSSGETTSYYSQTQRREMASGNDVNRTVARDEEAVSRPGLTAVTNRPEIAEIDAFFAYAENKMLESFAKKYNFDFEKEKPMEGRYEWERVEKP